LAAASIQMGSPASRKITDIPAVSRVATQGQSVRERRARRRGRRPSSESCESVREAPARGCRVPWSMLVTMNQIAAERPRPPSRGAKVGPSVAVRSSCSVCGPKMPSHTTGRTTK